MGAIKNTECVWLIAPINLTGFWKKKKKKSVGRGDAGQN